SERYPTAQEMQLDLEDLARELRLSLSAIHLATLMADLLDRDPGDTDPGLRPSAVTVPGLAPITPIARTPVRAPSPPEEAPRASGLEGPRAVRTLEGLAPARGPAAPLVRAPEGTPAMQSPEAASFTPSGLSSRRLRTPSRPQPALLHPATIDTGFDVPLETTPEATPFDVDTQVSAE